MCCLPEQHTFPDWRTHHKKASVIMLLLTGKESIKTTPALCLHFTSFLPPDYWLSLRRLLTLPFPSLPSLKHMEYQKHLQMKTVHQPTLYISELIWELSRQTYPALMSNSACIRLNEKSIQKIQKGMSYRLGWFTMESKSAKLRKIKNWGFYYWMFVLSLYLLSETFQSKKLN